MNNPLLKTICYGEILWDVFPTYKKIGGASLNVCIRLSSFGSKTTLISSVGKDAIGQELLTKIKKKHPNLNTQYIQESSFPTSEVKVSLDKDGIANYVIKEPVAWDDIKFENEIHDKVANSDILIFGSLVCRRDTSLSTLLQLLKVAKFKVFDVNLRPPHYTIKLIKKLMDLADFIKFNDEELFEISNVLGFNNASIEENIHFIAQITNTDNICVTKGANGAVLFSKNKFYYNKGYSVKVVDTVGSGDSFLASIVYKIAQNTDPDESLSYACAVGALVASHEGANPDITPEEITNLINS